jgi:hypothetical protein
MRFVSHCNHSEMLQLVEEALDEIGWRCSQRLNGSGVRRFDFGGILAQAPRSAVPQMIEGPLPHGAVMRLAFRQLDPDRQTIGATTACKLVGDVR